MNKACCQSNLDSISIVLPTHNRAFILERAVSSIIAQTFSNWELVIIDDGSTDKTIDVLDVLAKKDNRIRYYSNSSRRGQQKSKNRGILLSRNALILIAEDDVIFDKYCLQRLIESYRNLNLVKKDSLFGAVGPRLVEENLLYYPEVVNINALTGYIYTNFGLDTDHTVEVPTLHACSLISKEVFLKVGSLDEKLYPGFAYREETDLYFRAKKNCFHLYFEPKAIAYHLNSSKGGSHRGASRTKHGYYFIRNHIFFLCRFYGLRTMLMIPSFILFSLFVIRIQSKKPHW